MVTATRLVSEFETRESNIELSSLSTSEKTVEIFIDKFSESSAVDISLISLLTIGGSSTAVTFTVTVAASESTVPSFTLKSKLPCPLPLPFSDDT